MPSRTLTDAERDAYRLLAQAAAKLRKAQEEAQRQQEADEEPTDCECNGGAK